MLFLANDLEVARVVMHCQVRRIRGTLWWAPSCSFFEKRRSSRLQIVCFCCELISMWGNFVSLWWRRCIRGIPWMHHCVFVLQDTGVAILSGSCVIFVGIYFQVGASSQGGTIVVGLANLYSAAISQNNLFRFFTVSWYFRDVVCSWGECCRKECDFWDSNDVVGFEELRRCYSTYIFKHMCFLLLF